MLPRHQVQRWLDDYIAAWGSYDEDAILALFTPEATYAYHPYDEPVQGASAIAASWLEDPDEARSWQASYAPALIEGNAAIVKGETRYADGRVLEPVRGRVRRCGPLHPLHRVVHGAALGLSRLGDWGARI